VAASNLNHGIYGAYVPSIITQSPLSYNATLLFQPVVPGLFGK